MVSLNEAASTQQKPMESVLKEGLDLLSGNQVIRFYKYVKLVLPLDGYVFWVRADLLSPSALLNASVLNSFTPNQPRRVITAASYVDVKGSLHFDTRTDQGEEQTYSINRCVFTAEKRIDDFNEIGPQVLYIAKPPSPPFEGIKFAFSSRGPYYEQANLYHYLGDAVYADMQNIVIDDISQFHSKGLIVSNSLPIWLSMSNWHQQDWEPFGNPIPLYPSYLSPDDLQPPFATVHIPPDKTEALAASPTLGRRYQHDQLAADEVKITFYGLNNQMAMEFIDFVEQFCTLYGDRMGLMNQPVMRDEKRPQSELSAIAMKKSATYRVSYLQSQTRDITRQLILRSIPSFIFPD